MLTLPFGDGRLAGGVLAQIAKTAAIEGAVAGATQAVVEMRGGPYRQSLGLPDDTLKQIGMAAAGGAVIGGGLRALIAGVERALGRGAVPPAAVADAQAAVAAARGNEIVAQANPAGPEAAAAHEQAVAAALRAIETPEAPAPTVAAAGAAPARAAQPGAARYTAYTPTGRAVVVEPKVVELDRIIVSHDAEGRPNPAYPHKEGVQPRERGAAPSQDQVRTIASRLIPERLLPNVEASTGPPIVSNDLVAETGNGRVAALALVYRQPELAAQRAAYLETLRRAGYDLTGFREPVLVAERLSALSPAERSAFVREANKPVVAAETVVEQSRNDRDAVAAALPHWRGGDAQAAANRDFLRAFLNQLTPGERSGLLDAKGEPTPALAEAANAIAEAKARKIALAALVEQVDLERPAMPARRRRRWADESGACREDQRAYRRGCLPRACPANMAPSPRTQPAASSCVTTTAARTWPASSERNCASPASRARLPSSAPWSGTAAPNAPSEP